MQTSSTQSAQLLPGDYESSTYVAGMTKPPIGNVGGGEVHRNRLLIGSYAVLFTRYCIATFLSSFFTQVATQLGISGTFNGLIFAAYPAGMAITSMFAPQLIQRLGTTFSVTSGLLLTAVFTLLFGLAPDLASGFNTGPVQRGLLKYMFLISYFVNGLTGALAETACIIMVSNRFQDRLGTVMASVGTVSGIGCMVGPVLGGVLYDSMPDADDPPPTWAFRLPFLVCGILPLLLLPPLPLYMPNEHLQSDSASAPLSKVLSPSVVLGLLSVALSGTIVATLDPTLSYRLAAAPFRLSSGMISLFFMYSSIVYTVVSIPVGWMVDRFQNNSRVFKLITSIGFFFLALTFFLIAPFGFSGWGAGDTSFETGLNNMPATAFAMVLKGFGSALSNIAVYPDLVVGLPEDDVMLQATISGLWNAAYAAGWALGPVTGGVLYDGFQVNQLCVGKDANAPNCADHESVTSAQGCSCKWLPDNGFDGFGTAIAVICVAYGLVLGLAAAFNIGGKDQLPPQHGERGEGVQPLDAQSRAPPTVATPIPPSSTPSSGDLPALTPTAQPTA